MSGVLTGLPARSIPPTFGLDVQNPPAPQGILGSTAVTPPPPPASSNYPDAATIQALMTTPERAFQAYERQHPVSTRLEMLAAAMNGGPAAMEQQRQVLAARQMQPLALAQQMAQFGGIQGVYKQLGDAGRTDLQNQLLVDPAGTLKIISALQTPMLTQGGNSLLAPGIGGPGAPPVKMTADLLTPPAPGPVASVQTPNSFMPQGVVPVLGSPGQQFIAPPPVGAQAGGNQTQPSGNAGAYGLPTGLTAGDKILSPEDAHKSDPGLAAGFGLIVHQDGTKTPVPPNITEDQFNAQGAAYLNAAPHLEAQARSQALTGLGSILEGLPAGPIQAQTALNAYMGALNPHANQTRPSSMEAFIQRQSLPEDIHEQVSKMFGPGATLTVENVKQLYRAVDQLTRPVVAADGALLAPLQQTAQRYHYDASQYAKNQAKMPDVPAFARDALPPANQRHIGQVAWGAKGPAKWNGKAWTLIAGPQ